MDVFKLEIELENDAFRPDDALEVSRILRELADRVVLLGLGEIILKDCNGNTVGWARTEDD